MPWLKEIRHGNAPSLMNRPMKARGLRTYRFVRSNIFDLLVCIVIALLLMMITAGATVASKLPLNHL